MNRADRDRFVATTDQTDLAYGESACLETPPDLYATLNLEFNFEIDLTANKENRKHPVWFGPGAAVEDALAANWCHASRRCGFSNPPYGAFIPKILYKAIHEREYGFTSVFLLPMRASKWYTQYVLGWADEVRHIDRVKFWYHGQPKLNPANQKHETALFDSIVVVFRSYIVKRHGPIGLDNPQACPHVWYWKWQAESPMLGSDPSPSPTSSEEPNGETSV